MCTTKGRIPEPMYSEHPRAKNFLVLLTAKTENSVFLKQRRIPFTVLEMELGSFFFLEGTLFAAARSLLGETVISITEKKILSGQPWIARYGKASAGEALTGLVEELFGALPDSESALVFSNLGGRWFLTGLRFGFGAQDLAKADLERTLSGYGKRI